MRRPKFDPELPDFSGVINWLRQHTDLTSKQIGDLLNVTPEVIDTTVHRKRRAQEPKKTLEVIQRLDARASNVEQVGIHDVRDKTAPRKTLKRIELHERKVEEYGERFWQRVRNLEGTQELGLILRDLSEPASDNMPLLRVLFRANHLLCETYLHAGYCRSALHYGLTAFGTGEYIYNQTRSAFDLERLAKICLLISSTLILRQDWTQTRRWLAIANQAFTAACRSTRQIRTDPEYYRQLAICQFIDGATDVARKNLLKAMNLLPEYKRSATRAEVEDTGFRFLNVIADTPQWDDSQQLLHSALNDWPEYDIHRAINVNWTAACGFLTDSTQAHREALELLNQYQHLSRGFGHQATTSFLLALTPRLPKKLWPQWVVFVLYYNAYRNK